MSNDKKAIGSSGELKHLLESSDTDANLQPSDTAAPKPSPYDGLRQYHGKRSEPDARQTGSSLVEATPDDADAQAAQMERVDELNRREKAVTNRQRSLERRKEKLDSYANGIVARREKLKADQRALRAEQNHLKAERKRLTDLAVTQEKLSRLAQSLDRREAKLKKAEQAVKKKQEATQELRGDLRKAKGDVESLTKELRSCNRKIGRLGKQVEAGAMLFKQANDAEAAFAWMLENGRDDYPAPWTDIVVVGSGPFDDVDMWNFLLDRGVNVYETNTEGVSNMVVGREGWTEEKLEMQIAAQEGETLKVYSQEMALLVLASGADMFDVSGEDELNQLAGDHPALEFLRNSELRWPLALARSIPAEFRPFDFDDDAVDKSPLKELDYTVGKTKGLPAQKRKAILTAAYLNELPPVHSPEYMLDWGRPRTRRRLWRIANHLAWLARSWKATPSHVHAVRDWTTDLAMLEKTFYKPWMRFAWPKVKVPR